MEDDRRRDTSGHKGVFKVESLSPHVDLITIRTVVPGQDAVMYQQIRWDRKALTDVRVRKLICF